MSTGAFQLYSSMIAPYFLVHPFSVLPVKHNERPLRLETSEHVAYRVGALLIVDRLQAHHIATSPALWSTGGVVLGDLTGPPAAWKCQ